MALVVRAVVGSERVVPREAGAGLRLLPDLSGDEYSALKSSIHAQGVLVPVEVTPQGEILDGRARVRACLELGVAVPVVVRHDLGPEQQIVHSVALNAARRHLRPDQVRALVAYLRQHAALSGPLIAKTLAISRSTAYRHLQALDADPAFVEPPVVTGVGRQGQRPYRRKVGRGAPSGGLRDGLVGQRWVPQTEADTARLMKTARSELVRWLAHHQQHLREVPAFARAYQYVVQAIEALPDPPAV